MQYQIFVQNPAESRFTASVIGMPVCAAEGTTKEEALTALQQALAERFADGEIVTINWPAANGNSADSQPQISAPRKKGDFSSLPGYGIFKDDPTFDDFIERMAEFRARFDAEAEATEQ
jgi:predicted RNase H-like HicB family nuclease